MDKFFIVGCPRSGTTMLQQALNRHSQIIIPPETKFFFSFFGHSRKRQARHIQRINADLDIRLPIPARQVCLVDEGRAWYEDMARQYVARQHKRDIAWFGEKTPEHTGRLPCIRELFPSAKVVVLCRDGRDVASSLTRVPWMSSNLYVNFLVWLYYSSLVQKEMLRSHPNLYCVRYEDLVTNPKKELAAILDFLCLSYEPAVAEGAGNLEGIPRRELPWKGRALERITTQRVGVFRQELTRDQIERLERLGKEVLPALGYPLLTGGKRALSFAFLLSLGQNLARLLWRLPSDALVKELLCRLYSGGSTGRSSPGSLLPTPSWEARHESCPNKSVSVSWV
jgi:hypothetical protein